MHVCVCWGGDAKSILFRVKAIFGAAKGSKKLIGGYRSFHGRCCVSIPLKKLTAMEEQLLYNLWCQQLVMNMGAQVQIAEARGLGVIQRFWQTNVIFGIYLAYLYLFSLSEHDVLVVSYCDCLMSVVHKTRSTVCIKQPPLFFLHFGISHYILMTCFHNENRIPKNEVHFTNSLGAEVHNIDMLRDYNKQSALGTLSGNKSCWARVQ